ncbi:hypothetical protein P8452_36301 [Trifolium repens]|nr:hypothetical protein P8452_36301 [Trifolium repens]
MGFELYFMILACNAVAPVVTIQFNFESQSIFSAQFLRSISSSSSRLFEERKHGQQGSKAPSWSDQWGTGGLGSDEYEDEAVKKNNKSSSGSGKKMTDAKLMATASMDKAKSAAIVGADKAKTAAVVGAQKVKSGTSAGLKWIKNQYQKKTSK